MRLAYLVHNLADPAVAKRVRMLRTFGDEIVPIGFHRDEAPVAAVESVAATDLGRTFDAGFRQRIAMVLRQAVNLSAWAARLRDCDVIIARNLEMLLLGALARARYAPQASLVYEALDIHRLLLSEGLVGKTMRRLERALLHRVDLLIVSSSAFLRAYFEPRQRLGQFSRLEVLLVENKLLPATNAEPLAAPSSAPASGPPWRMGWFGMIRCRKSLDYLCAVAARHPDLLHLTIKGRPSYTEFADFDAQIARTPNASFGGAYRPAELAALYGGVHFNWAIDLFEEGANSRWLLPNRIYEGGAFDAVPIALAGTETARWLEQLGIGVVLESLEALEEFLLGLTPERYTQLKTASRAAPRNAFLADQRDCSQLLDALQRARRRRAEDRQTNSPAPPFALGPTGSTRDDAAM